MRLDKYLAAHFGSRTKSAQAIEKGLILINGKTVNPSYEYKETDVLTILKAEESYVSNGGFKLSKALKDFDFSVSEHIIADIGASNGGFTDCLFQNGAKKVYCIDVGENQLDSSLLSKNITIMDNCNARYLTKDMFHDHLDGVVIDVSFISLTYILEGVANILDDGGYCIALIKPQFECEQHKVGKNGIVRDPKQREKIIEKIYTFANSVKLNAVALTNAPIHKDKNIEYLMLFIKNGNILPFEKLKKITKN